MSVILPSRLSWALSDRPSRSKGMWFGILGAFVAGIAVAGVAGHMPKVETEASIKPEQAPVAVKVASSKPASAPETTGALKAKIGSGNPAAKARPEPQGVGAADGAVGEKPLADQKPVADQSVRIVGADRITPPPGVGDGPSAVASPAGSVEKPAPVTPSEIAQGVPSTPQSATTPPFLANSHEVTTAEAVPMPRDKPAALTAKASSDVRELADTGVSADPSAEDARIAVSNSQPTAVIEGIVPLPRAKPAIEEPSIETAARQPENAVRSPARAARLDEDDRNVQNQRKAYDRRSASIDSRSEMRRIERAEARAAAARARETRQRNEDEGFELVHSYRGRDGRRVSVYQRMEPRVLAYQPRPLFGRPAFLAEPRGFWR